MITDIKISPENLLQWSDMEDWVSGASAAPTNHTLSGAGASIAREATIVKHGTYSAKVTRAGADCTLYHDLTSYLTYAGRKMTFGAWVYATVASRARLSIGDGVGTSNSSYHSGGSSWEFLTVTRDIDPSATRIRCGMEVNTGNTDGYFDGAILCDGDATFTDLSPYVESWAPQGSYRLESYTVARRDGKIVPNLNFDTKAISLSGTVVGNDIATSRTGMDAIVKAINPQRISPDGKTTKHDLYLYDDRILKVLISSWDVNPKAALRAFQFKAKMQAVNPFYQGLQKTRVSQSLSSSPITFTVTTVGNIYTLPIFQFTPAGSNMTACTLENLTTGEVLSFSATVNTGNILAIDSDLHTVTNNAVDSIASFTGDFIRLLPGANQFRFAGTTGGVLTIDWFEKYLFG